MRKNTLLTGSAIALGAALTMASPAQAQAVCELTIGAATNQTGGSTAADPGDLACGEGAVAGDAVTTTPGTAVAIGNAAKATNNDAVAIGDKANASGFHSTAIGGEAVASGAGSQAFGWKANATGAQSVAVGNQAQATGANSTTLGNGATASGTDSTAIGQGASTAGFANSVALGKGTVNTAANQVSIGGRTLGGVADGILASDAVNLGQLNAAIGRLDRKVEKADEGVAMALALDSPNVPDGATFAVSGGIGGYQGKHALATAISAAVGEMSIVSAGLGYGLDSGEIGYRAGFQFAF